MCEPEALASFSTQFLGGVKRNDDTATHRSELAELDEPTLARLSRDENAAKTFWINIYNAFVQFTLDSAPSLYERRRRFFGANRFQIAGTRLSLDDIEHGLLRSSKWKYGLGYVPRPFPSTFEREHRLPEVDPRIHFALNCGAKSCPPIIAYESDEIDEQLELCTRNFLRQSSTYDPGAGEVHVTRLFLYYRGDFGGRGGIYDFLERYDVIKRGARPRVRYEQYDWGRQPGQYGDAGD